MKTVDLHGMTWAEARELIVETCNASVADSSFEEVDVIHGYGKSGTGGVMRTAVRSFLDSYGIFYNTGELLDNNPGHTVVHPERPLPEIDDRLQSDILNYCSTPKTKEQVAGKYRRSGAPAVDAALKALVGAKLLRVLTEGRVKRFVADGQS